jgi:hypothetical protein
MLSSKTIQGNLSVNRPPAAELMSLTNNELLEATVNEQQVTPTELELLLRLETYIAMYGDYLEEQTH